MIDLCYSNRTEPLLDALAENVKATQATLYDPVLLLVPNTFVADYVAQGLARRRGIAAHVKTGFLRAFLRDVAKASAPDLHIVDRDILEGALLALFHDDDRLAAPELAPVRGYLEPGDADRDGAGSAAGAAGGAAGRAFRRVLILAARHADGVAQGPARVGMERAAAGAGSASCGCRCSVPAGRLSGADSATLPDFFARTPPAGLRVPGPAHVFGISFVARLYRTIFASLARATSLYIYTLNPCRELWEDFSPCAARRPGDVAASRQLALALGDERRRRRLPPPPTRIRCSRSGDGPGATASGSTTSCPTAISTSASRTRPAGTASPTLLATLQREVLDRAPRGREPAPRDDSLVMFAAPDPRRELETVAAEILVAGAARRRRCASTISRSWFRRGVGRRRTCRWPARCSRRRPSCRTRCSTCRRPPRATS